MYNYSHGCTHIPPQQCTRLCIWGQKELNLRPFSVGTTFVVLHLIFFCLFCATVWLRDARVCPQLAFRLSPHPFPKGCSFFSSAHTPSEPVGLLYGLLSFKLALFPAPDPVDYHHQCNCNHPVTWPIGGGNPHRASGWIINIPLAGSVAKTFQPQINDQQKKWLILLFRDIDHDLTLATV